MENSDSEYNGNGGIIGFYAASSWGVELAFLQPIQKEEEQPEEKSCDKLQDIFWRVMKLDSAARDAFKKRVDEHLEKMEK